MTIRDLDRLITKTELTPPSKRALRKVRSALLSGNVSDPDIGSAHWTVGIEDTDGSGVRVTFSFKKD